MFAWECLSHNLSLKVIQKENAARVISFFFKNKEFTMYQPTS